MGKKILQSLRSKATSADKEHYTRGECHVLAVALHRHLGWPILVMSESGQPWWQDPKDPSLFTRKVAHVYAISPDGWAWDIRGAKPVERIDQDMRSFFGLTVPAVRNWCLTERDIFPYVDRMGKGLDHLDRPLGAYSEEDVELSWGVAEVVFAGLPAFEAARPMKVSRKRARPC